MPSTPLIACSSGVVTASRLLRVGAGVDRRDRDAAAAPAAGTAAIGIVGIAMSAAQDDDQRADRCEDRPPDESVDEHGYCGLHGRAVGDLLDAADDQLVARLQAALTT
jgi:hypothetical protein